MSDVPYCDLCEMNCDSCSHGLAERRAAASASASSLQISPRGMAHFRQCLHKGDDPDFSNWADLVAPRAGQRLGNGEHLPATGGARSNLVLLPDVKPASITAHGEAWLGS
jgi:hypothetical protein